MEFPRKERADQTNFGLSGASSFAVLPNMKKWCSPALGG